MIVAAGLTSLGSWVKVGSVGRDRFWVTMVGQVVVAVGQVFMLFLPPRLASVWFGPDQVSLACSMGFIGILVRAASVATSRAWRTGDLSAFEKNERVQSPPKHALGGYILS